MGQFDYFSAQAISRKNDYTLYKCPLCGTDNNINSTECKYCRYSLKEFESVYFSRFNNYNEAITLLEENKIVTAYEKIISFLEYYPKDVDAQHLRLYILFLLKDEDFNVKAENYLQENSDRWAVKLIDSPESISLKDFSRKIVFEGNTFLPSIEKLANAKQEERIKITAQLKDFANQIYDIYCKVQQQKNKSPIFEQIKFFYEKIFIEFLLRNEMNIPNYLGLNYNDLTDEEKKVFGAVDTIEDKKKPSGQVVKVFQPEIRYHSLIIQRAKITINVHPNKKEVKEK